MKIKNPKVSLVKNQQPQTYTPPLLRVLNKPLFIFIFSFALIAATFLFYFGSMKNDFVWDDLHFIVKDPAAHNFSRWREFFTHNMGYLGGQRNNFYRPLYSLLNALNYKMGGGTPYIFHATNTLLQAGVSILVCILIFLICKNAFIASATALLFALHPIHTQAVTYIAGRADPMYSFFALSAVICFITCIEKKGNIFIYFGCLLSFVFAILSKEAAAITPFLILLCAYAASDGDRIKRKKIILAVIPLFLILAIYGILRLTLLDFSKNVYSTLSVPTPPLYIRTLTACKAIFLYFRFLLFPVGFHMEVFLPMARSIMERESFTAVVGVIFIITGLFYAQKHNKLLFFGLSWFFLTLLPVLNLFPLNAPAAIHWLYLPSMGFFFAISLILWDLFYKRSLPFFIAIFVILGLILGILTYEKNREWRNEETLYKSILPFSQTPRVYINLGNIFTMKKEFDKAIPYYLKAIEIAPAQTEAYANLGYIYDNKKEYGKAVETLKLAVKMSPKLANAHLNLGVTYVHMGKYDEAIDEMNKAIELNPNNTAALNVLGKIYFQLGKKDEARKAFERSLGIDGEQPEVRDLLTRFK